MNIVPVTLPVGEIANTGGASLIRDPASPDAKATFQRLLNSEAPATLFVNETAPSLRSIEPANSLLDLDIEKALASVMPRADSSPAEFALGLLRAQVKVSKVALEIEMVSKSANSLTQGIQSLTSHS